jgi:hypothetical protein
VKYPQEVIPAMDQVLKDLMLELADADQQAGREGMIGAEGEEEIKAIMAKVYKVRPFGIKTVGMRELNPSGACYFHSLPLFILLTTPYRHRHVDILEGSHYSCDPHPTGHAHRVLQMSRLCSHSLGTYLTWQDNRT